MTEVLIRIISSKKTRTTYDTTIYAEQNKIVENVVIHVDQRP